eukprot:scaffold25682_cov131-Isochrysis_galbana.AAC.5
MAYGFLPGVGPPFPLAGACLRFSEYMPREQPRSCRAARVVCNAIPIPTTPWSTRSTLTEHTGGASSHHACACTRAKRKQAHIDTELRQQPPTQ